MGNPEFAVPSLKILQESSHSIAAVLSNPPKIMGRNRKLKHSSLAHAALELDLNLIHADDLTDSNLLTMLKDLKPDIFAVVAYRILPESMLSIPASGSINLHGSLLPAYRGAAPIQRALMQGEIKTGLSTFLIERKIDAGKILLQKQVLIDPQDDYGSLYNKMSFLGAELLLNTVNQYAQGLLTAVNQTLENVTSAPKITKADCRIDWSHSVEKIINLIRALGPVPGAFTHYNKKRIKIYKSEIVDLKNSLEPGTIIKVTGEELVIQTGTGRIKIIELQIEGRKRMFIEEFLKGVNINAGESFK